MTSFPVITRHDALFLARCLYLAPILLLWPLKSPIHLARYGSDHFHPPLGPFQLFPGHLPGCLVLVVEAAILILFGFWIWGKGSWKVGGALSLLMTFLSGFVYSTGKVDHDFAILLAPLLLTLPRPRDTIAIALCIYYASSGLAKAAGGWLDSTTQATLSWALYYDQVCDPPVLLLDWTLSTFPGWLWELCDQVTVIFEVAVPLALLPSFRRLILPLVPLFHLGVILLFGIDFSRLLLLYLPLAVLAMASEEAGPMRGETIRWLKFALLAGLSVALVYRIAYGGFWKMDLPPNAVGLVAFPLLAVILGARTLLSLLRRDCPRSVKAPSR